MEITEQYVCGNAGADLCKVGSIGPGGGPIFFVDYHDQYPGFNYLEAAPDDIAPVGWCDKYTTLVGLNGWSANGVGKGQANTMAMLTVCTSGAANVADAYISPTGQSDYFLPSLGELMLMYTNLRQAGVGGFANDYYWSSTENDSNNAWFQYFNYGGQNPYLKFYSIRVRAVRAF